MDIVAILFLKHFRPAFLHTRFIHIYITNPKRLHLLRKTSRIFAHTFTQYSTESHGIADDFTNSAVRRLPCRDKIRRMLHACAQLSPFRNKESEKKRREGTECRNEFCFIQISGLSEPRCHLICHYDLTKY